MIFKTYKEHFTKGQGNIQRKNFIWGHWYISSLGECLDEHYDYHTTGCGMYIDCYNIMSKAYTTRNIPQPITYGILNVSVLLYQSLVNWSVAMKTTLAFLIFIYIKI